MVKNGMPMEKLQLPTFQEANQQARNAEEALLAVLNACARATKKVSQIKWPSSEAFGNWISRLRGQRVDNNSEIFCLNCLSFLDLQNCILVLQDFYEANLFGAILVRANLEGAHLGGADLLGANLIGANLLEANLEGAHLGGAILLGAILKGANLEGANLEGADLDCAILQGANLEGANVHRTILEGKI
jgi:uncharacterized protein YjbI with pentapeptide repeats